MRMFSAAVAAMGALALAGQASAAVVTYAGSASLPTVYAEGPEAAAYLAAMGAASGATVGFSLTLDGDVVWGQGANYKNYLASDFSLTINGVEYLSPDSPFGNAYVGLRDFGQPQGLLQIEVRASGDFLSPPGNESINFLFQYRPDIGAFGADFALPMDLAALGPSTGGYVGLSVYDADWPGSDSSVTLRGPFAEAAFSITPAPSEPGAVGAVPEPATWALMIGGFGLAGAALRRRRAASALA